MPTAPVIEYELSGEWHRMGGQLGRAQALEIRRFNEHFFDSPINRFRFGSLERVWEYAAKVSRVLEEFSGCAFHFLRGMAEGASLPMERVVAQACAPELTHIAGESDFAAIGCTACGVSSSVSTTQSALLAQNWDFNFDLPAWYVLRLRPPLDEPARVMVGMGAVFACCGVSGTGLAATFTSSGHLPPVRPTAGLPVTALVLEVLGSQDFDEAMGVAVALPRAGSFNMMVTEEYTRNALVEATPRRVEIIDGKETLVAGNHFQHPAMVARTAQDLTPPDRAGREFARSSVLRAERFEDLLANRPSNGLTPEALMGCLKDHANHPLSICCHEEETLLRFRTQGSVLLEPAAQALRFCSGQPCCGRFETYPL
ncbi:MAG: hypothetical protein GXY33_17405 [Phycisphaerae bacterium]|nr:hypothetical protein [Phycisphaerae bacterium]